MVFTAGRPAEHTDPVFTRRIQQLNEEQDITLGP